MTDEEAEGYDHDKLKLVIELSKQENDFVIVEGFKLLHTDSVVTLLTRIFLIDIGREEARRRRCQPQPPGAFEWPRRWRRGGQEGQRGRPPRQGWSSRRP